MANRQRINYTISSEVKNEFEKRVQEGERSRKAEEILEKWLEKEFDYQKETKMQKNLLFSDLDLSPKQNNMLNLLINEAPRNPTPVSLVRKSKSKGIYVQTGSAKSCLQLFEKIDCVPFEQNGGDADFQDISCECGAFTTFTGLVKNRGKCPSCETRLIAGDRFM